MKKMLLLLFILMNTTNTFFALEKSGKNTSDLEVDVKVNELFAERDNKEKLLEAIHILDTYLTENDNYEMLVIASRAYYNLGEHESKKSAKLDIYAKGLEYGERALKTIENFETAALEDEAKALDLVTTDKMDALYWSAANQAKWAKYAPFTKKVASKSRVRLFWDKVMEKDSTYFYGGVYRFWGGYFALVPSITGEQDPVKSKAMFEKALVMAPEYLDTKVLYAEVYCTHAKIKDQELFDKLLNDVLKADEGKDINIIPENRLAKVKAQRLLDEKETLFE